MNKVFISWWFQSLPSLNPSGRNRLWSQCRPYEEFEVDEAAYRSINNSICGPNSKASRWGKDVFSSDPLRQASMGLPPRPSTKSTSSFCSAESGKKIGISFATA